MSNPASQDYVMEKLKDMEQHRLNEESERFVPKQVELPEIDDDQSDSEMHHHH